MANKKMKDKTEGEKDTGNGRSANTGFATPAFADDAASKDGPPAPSSPGETYLLALLATQSALNAALNALTARAGEADAEETAYITIQRGLIQADYLKVDSQIGVYLSNQTIFKLMSQKELDAIREILNRIQSFTAKRDKASAIVDAVTELLNKWKP